MLLNGRIYSLLREVKPSIWGASKISVTTTTLLGYMLFRLFNLFQHHFKRQISGSMQIKLYIIANMCGHAVAMHGAIKKKSAARRRRRRARVSSEIARRPVVSWDGSRCGWMRDVTRERKPACWAHFWRRMRQRAGIDACVQSASGRSEQRGMVVKSYSFCPLQALLGHVGSLQRYCVLRKHAPHVSCHVQRHVFTAGPRLGSWDCD